MMDALEVAGKTFYLPALVGPNLPALHAAAGTDSFLGTQFVDLGRDGKVFEVGEMPSARAPLQSPQLVLVLLPPAPAPKMTVASSGAVSIKPIR